MQAHPDQAARDIGLDLNLTFHALRRSRTRGIPQRAIEATLDFGRVRSTRGADFFTLGWREVRHYAELGIDLSRWVGIEVVCARSGEVITVYRNKNPRALRDKAGRHQAA
jgi:hypothetical protein